MALFTVGNAHAATVLVIGDSISAGFGLPVQQGWVALAQSSLQQQHPEVQLINASISGDTTAGGRNRLPALLQQHQPQLVVIELGGNDALRGTPIQVIRNNLSAMVEQSQQAGADVLLLGMQIPPNYGAAYTQAFANVFQQVSDAHDTLLVPFLLEGIATQPEMMQADGIHPTAKAQPHMSDMVSAKVRYWLNTQ
ncbi:arylesterase [Bacterioplanes sanyensis]|uniref:arylesterase n=1 Tax=Bacterioplanes sanyensis TaxID=1249553 RepID=UPI0016768F2A|nr:arylesterase [Bacterioplanes sanyensis]GGY52103.1 arylesterase [Bacterioplanes sanyensis]